MSNDPFDPTNDPNYRPLTPLPAMDGDEVELRDAPLYERTGRTRCQVMPAPFALVTLDGSIEAGEIGDYLCEHILSDGSPGPRFAVPARRFSALYRLIAPPNLAPAEPGEFGADAMRDNPFSVHYRAEVEA